ncbi:unnamed protein product, partial [Discosporangium mesarthrocarpum]
QEFNLLSSESGRADELAFTDTLINSDLRNNSAWNHRWFAVNHTDGTSWYRVTDEVVRKETEYALAFAALAPSNESPWNYVRGFFKKGWSYSDFPKVKERVLEIQ